MENRGLGYFRIVPPGLRLVLAALAYGHRRRAGVQARTE